MKTIESFRIELDSRLAIYYPGQTVSGKIILELNEEMTWKGIFIQAKGMAHVHWSKRRNNKTVHYSGRQIYFNFEKVLRASASNENAEKIGPGLMQYPFAMTLPANLPGSFEGKHGYIRYTCSSYISRPWKFNPKFKMGFTVLDLVDLNLIPRVAAPWSGEYHRNTGCWCYKTGSISAAVSLDKTGFVPGEGIVIRANVKNNSNAEIKRTTADLIRLVTYVVGKHVRRKSVKVCSVHGAAIPPHNTGEWTNNLLRIPPTPPSRSLSSCKLISLDHFLQFTVEPSGLLNGDLEFTIPITIGSIPLQTDFLSFAPMGLNEGSGGANNSQTDLLPNGANPYPDIPLPSYEECVSGKADIREEDDEHTSGDLQFAPRYMYYNQKEPIS